MQQHGVTCVTSMHQHPRTIAGVFICVIASRRSHHHINQPAPHNSCPRDGNILRHHIHTHTGLPLAMRHTFTHGHTRAICLVAAPLRQLAMHKHLFSRTPLRLHNAKKPIERHALAIRSGFELVTRTNTGRQRCAHGFAHLLVLTRLWREISAAANFCKGCKPHLDGTGSNARATGGAGAKPQKQGTGSQSHSQR